MNINERFNGDKVAQAFLNTTAPKGARTGVRSSAAIASAFTDILERLAVTETPKWFLNTVKPRGFSADDIRKLVKYFKAHGAVAMPVLEHIYGNITFTELVAILEKNMVVSFAAGGVVGIVVGVGGVVIVLKVREYVTSDEYKAMREAKEIKRFIKKLEKAGYTVIPPDDIDLEL